MSPAPRRPNRYDRLVDISLRIPCCPLRSHLPTTVEGMGQVETNEFRRVPGGEVRVCEERHFQLVPPAGVSADHLAICRSAPE